jgi:hypothetical protein
MKVQWVLSIDPEVKKAAIVYAEHIGDSASHMVQDIIKAALQRKGYWPPKEKAQ